MATQINVTKLKDPVWFDIGLKMQDGTPRTIAAYDTKELSDYMKKESPLGTFQDIGDYRIEDTAKWKPLNKVPEVPDANIVPGMTKRGRPKNNG